MDDPTHTPADDPRTEQPLPRPTSRGEPMRVGRYRILRRIGQGATGVVFEAEDETLGRRAAIKLLPGDLSTESEWRSRFLREARAAAQIHHPNVVAVFDAGEDAGHFFLALELVPGGSLQDRLALGPIPWREAVRLLAGACKGLAAIHAADIVHRDLKPGNILLGADGTVKIADFGLARLRAEESIPGKIMGTPAYMSPEQCRGQRPDERSDVYALGATLHALVAGKPPYSGSAMEVMFAHCSRTPPDLDGVPAALNGLIRRAMARERSGRHASAEALLADLERFLAPDTVPVPPIPRPPSRRVLLVGAGLGAVGAGLLWWAWPRSDPKPAPEPSLTPAAWMQGIPSQGTRFVIEGDCSELAFTPDGKRLAVAMRTAPGGLRFWDMETGHPLGTVWPKKTLTALAFSPDGTMVAGGDSSRNEILLHHLADAKEDPLPLGESHHVVGLAFLPGKPLRLVAALKPAEKAIGVVRFWEFPSRRTWTLEPVRSPFTAFAVSSDGALVAAGSEDTLVRLWKGTEKHHEWRMVGKAHGLAFSPDGTRLAAAIGRALARYETQTGTPTGPAFTSGSSLWRCAWLDAGRVLTVGDHPRVWAHPKGTSRVVIQADHAHFRLAVHPAGQYAAFGGMNDVRVARLPRDSARQRNGAETE